MSYDFTPGRRDYRKLIALIVVVVVGLLLLYYLSPPVSACNDDCKVTISINNILTQIAYITQQQSQQQYQTMSTAPMSGWVASGSATPNSLGVVQESQTYSRLMYPGEVLTYPVSGGKCKLLAGLPVAFYTISSGHGYFEDQVQTLESIPSYDPIYHKMEFGMTPVVNSIQYYTMKAELSVSSDAKFCVIDNRAPFNDYTTIEVIVEV